MWGAWGAAMTGAAGFSDAPLYVGSLTLIRAWGVQAGPRLVGLYGKEWTPGENIAKCHRTTFAWSPEIAKHDAPMPPGEDGKSKCGCGFWAYWPDRIDLPGVMSYNPGLGSIMGVTECYGRMVCGEKGVRCEKARILAVAPADRKYRSSALYAALREFDSKLPVYNSIAVMMRDFEFSKAPSPDEVRAEAKLHVEAQQDGDADKG